MSETSTYKSIDYSKKETKKSWGILSFGISKKNDFNKVSAFNKLFLTRTIIYIEDKNKVSQIGKLYVPLFSLKYFILFIQILFSRKTLGHYINEKYEIKDEVNVSFELINKTKSSINYEILLSKEEYDIEERIISIVKPNLIIYVEEFS